MPKTFMSPRRHGREAVDHADRRGLAGAVGPQDPETLTAMYRERQAVHGHEIAEGLPQVGCLDDRFHAALLSIG